MSGAEIGAGRPGGGDLTQVGCCLAAPEVDSDGISVDGKRPSIFYRYYNARCDIVGGVARFEAGTLRPDSKAFRQFRFDGGRLQPGLKGEALPLYRLPGLLAEPDAIVVWVEGEKCVDALTALGFVATTTPGGSSGFAAWVRKAPDGLECIAGRTVVVLADSDEPGARYAGAVANQLASLGCEVRLPHELPWAEFGEGADVVDWLEAGHGAEDLRAVVAEAEVYLPEEAAPSSAGQLAPGDDLSVPPEHPVLESAALHGLAGQFVAACRPYTEAHDAGLLYSFLSVAGCCCGADPEAPVVYVGADRHHARLNVTLCGPTGRGRKGSAWAPVRMLIELMNDADEAHHDSTSACAAALGKAPDTEAVLCRPGTPHVHDGGLSSGEGLIYRIRDERETGKTKPRGGAQSEPIIDEGEPDKRLLVYQPEFAGVLRMGARDGNTLADIIRASWDGTTKLAPLTKNDRICASRPHICIVANITAEELREMLHASSFFGGFVNRFLWVAVRRARLLPLPERLPEELLLPIAQRVRHAVLEARGRTFRMSSAATVLWRRLYCELENRALAGFTAKATDRASPYVLRLALVYAVLDCSEVIDACHLEAACAAWSYAQASAAFIFGGGGDVLYPESTKLLEALKECGGSMAVAEVYRLFKGHIQKDHLEVVLAQLADAGLIDTFTEKTKGRPRKVIRALQENP